MKNLETKLIENGVKNLKEFGYPYVNSENILTDEIYKEFFKKMLYESKGHKTIVDKAINNLLNKIK